MPVANQNKMMIDRPDWEQLPFAPVQGTSGTSMTDDGVRFIYVMFAVNSTTVQFWQYDTWFDGWQQLATPPSQTITLGKIVFTPHIGSQWSGQVFGSIYSFQANDTVCYLYRYDIGANTWTTLTSSTVPANFGTDVYMCYPQPFNNNYEGVYHSGVTRTITTSTTAAVGSTTVSVNALPQALAANTVLDFGKLNITLTSPIARGGVTMAVTALAQGIAANATITSPDGLPIMLSAAAAAGATSITIYPIIKALPPGSVCWIRKKAVLTSAAAASDTSVTVSGLLVSLGNGDSGYYYDHIYLIGNDDTAIYRYNISSDAWYTTSANTDNPDLPQLPGGAGTGCSLKWLPLYSPDKLWILRGAGTATAYMYDLTTNTVTEEIYHPATETFSTGTWVTTRNIGGKQGNLIIQKDATMRFYKTNPVHNRMSPMGTQWLYPTSTAVIGDRMVSLTSPDGVEYLYCLLHSSTGFLRCALIDQ